MQELVSKFSPIRLDQMDEVMFMNRIDRKYCIKESMLPEFLETILPYYYCLEIESKRIFLYSNTYYDNTENDMYNDHLRGKMNRYKIRVRNYDVSGQSFLEVKFKTNKGKTFKSRILCNGENDLASGRLGDFLKSKTPFDPVNLLPVMKNKFHRITLVSKKFNERCTIDFNLSFMQENNAHELEKVAIVEVKSEGHTKSTPILHTIRSMKNTKDGFSKYCFGRSLLEQDLKNNGYRSKIRHINKLQVAN